MADLEERVYKLEEKVAKLELDINTSLGEIKTSLAEIKTYIKTDMEANDLKNNLISKDVVNNTTRITKLEENQNKIVWTIIVSVIGLIGEAVIFFMKNGGN